MTLSGLAVFFMCAGLCRGNVTLRGVAFMVAQKDALVSLRLPRFGIEPLLCGS